MKKIAKLLLILLVIPFIGYAGFLLYLKNSINVVAIRNDLNGSFAEKIQEYKKHHSFAKKDIKFLIRGKVVLSVFPKVKIMVNDVNLNDVQFRGHLLSINIKKLELRLNFLDFLKKKVTINDIKVDTITANIQQNELATFYINKVLTKKVVKMEENEVIGIKTKIKNLLVDNKNNDIEEGYKEIEVVEDVRVELDNSEVEYMFLNLLKMIKINNILLKDNLKVTFSNAYLNYIRNGVIQKEVKSISGTVDKGKKININCSFLLNNINGDLKVTYLLDKDKNSNITLKLTDSMNDNISVTYEGNNLMILDYKDVVADIKIDADIKSFNDFSQWILFSDSKYYYLIDYKKGLKLETNLAKNLSLFDVKTFSLKGDDVDISGSFHKSETFGLTMAINKLNLDDVVINTGKNMVLTDDNEIAIFKTSNIDDLLEELSSKDNNKNKSNGNIKVDIKELTKGSRIIKDSVFDIDVVNGNYKINNFKVNLNGMTIDVYNQESKGDLFVNDLKIEGQSFDDVVAFLSLPNFFGIKEFTIESKIFAQNNVIYLLDYSLKNAEQKVMSGSLEYSLDRIRNYIACIMDIDSLAIKLENQKNSTLKEELLWLNNFTKNVFIDLSVKNLSYNAIQNIDVKTKLNFSPGYLNLYDIANVNFETIKNISGKISLDIRNKGSAIYADLSIGSIKKNVDLVNYVLDIEKYKSLLLRTEINKENRANYWVNKLFSFPTLDSIDGHISLKIQDFLLNNLPIKNIETDANINNGVINIKNMSFDGLGGATNIKASLDIKNTRRLSLTLNETIYNISDIAKLFITNDEIIGDLTGTIGLAGIINGVGFNSEIFNSSLNMQFKFIGNNFFIKKLGLDDLRKKLSLIYTDKNIRDNFNTKDIIANNTGTTFNNFSGDFVLASSIGRLTAKAEGAGISSNVDLKVDSSTGTTAINLLNTSLIMVKAGQDNFPLYINISFLEDFANKANLIINTSQVDEYVKQVIELSEKSKNNRRGQTKVGE